MNKFLFVAALALTGSVLSGCGLLDPPAAEPKPKEPKTPPIDFFAPEDFVTHGVKLPGTWRMDGVDASNEPDSNELVIMRSVTVTERAGQPPLVKVSPVSEKMRLAGIILPPKGGPGRAASVNAILGWTRGRNDLVIEGDPVYPVDIYGRRLVQIYFKGTGKDTEGKDLNLNRMLVRSGYAIVDLHQASSIKPELWFNDEQYARLRRDPKDPTKPAPLGLWKMGIVLGQRPPAPGAPKVLATPGPGGATAPIGGTTVISKTTKTTTIRKPAATKPAAP